ncbi:hypothetical protein ACE1AT_16940 [Pelatocladus sp. BLCC-F211]|uniref:hypothetical protein n=1 Tax=Pelatocladus sp. BLCC-F211 TaxID=3342752 RepID=UPI0035B8205E
MAKTKNLQILFFVFLVLSLLSGNQQRSLAVLNTNKGDWKNQVKYSPWRLEVATTQTKPACPVSKILYSVDSKSVVSDSICLAENHITSELLIYSINSTIALNDQDLYQEFQQLEETNRKFEVSVNEFISQIERALTENKLTISVNSKNAVSELETLNKLNNSLSTKIQTSDKFSNDNKNKITGINSSISSDIEQMKTILIPLESGLNEKTISQVQEKLQIPSDGKFGRGTFEEIKQVLNLNNKQINSKINELEKGIKHQNYQPTNNPPTNIQTDNRNENSGVFISGIGIGVAIGVVTGLGIGVAIGMWLQQRILYQKSNETSSEKPDNNINTRTHPVEPTKLNKPSFDQQEQYPDTQTNNPELDDTFISPRTSLEIPTQPPTYYSPPTNPQPNTQRNFPSSKSQIVQIYNQNSKSLNKDATEVSETTDSINQRRLGGHQSVTLEKVSKGKGNYWILPEQGFLCLLPKGNLKINEYNYETVAALFDCHNYQSGYSNDFQLITPATVISVGQDQWELQERGELQF